MHENLKSNLIGWLTCFFVFTIPFVPIQINVRILIFLLAVSFFSNEFEFSLRKLISEAGGILFYLVVLTIGVFYSSDSDTSLSVLETNFSFLALALLVSRYKYFSARDLNFVFVSFVAGVVVASLICLFFALIQFQQTGDAEVFCYQQFTKVIDSHPTYFAYYIIFSITYILNSLSIRKRTKRYWTYSFLVIFLFLILMLTGGRTAFMSLLLICSFFLLNSILGKRNLEAKWTSYVSVILIIGIFAINYFLPLRNGNHIVADTSLERFTLWEASLKANSNFLLGVGTGDYKSELNNYYAQHNMANFATFNLNAHNEFLQIFFSNGMLGLLAVLFLLGRPLYMAVKNDHAFGILVFFPFLIYGVTEVFLGRYQGIIFFALLHQIFVSYYHQAKPAIVSKSVRPIISPNVTII